MPANEFSECSGITVRESQFTHLVKSENPRCLDVSVDDLDQSPQVVLTPLDTMPGCVCDFGIEGVTSSRFDQLAERAERFIDGAGVEIDEIDFEFVRAAGIPRILDGVVVNESQ